MEKSVTIDGKKVRFACSAAIVYLYQRLYGRDILLDISTIRDELEKANADPSYSIQISTLILFEQAAHAMAYHADSANVPLDIGEWLDQFSIFSIYQIFPVIMELWQESSKTLVKAKKKQGRRSAK